MTSRHGMHPPKGGSTHDYKRLDKAAINRLPLFRYDGPVSVVRDRGGLKKALSALEEETLLGFDTETRPAFKKGVRHPPALLQLAGAGRVYVFQLGAVGFPPSLRALLSDASRIKAGIAHGHDVRELRALADFQPAGFVELETLAKRAGLKNFGLRGLAAALLGVRISKNARLSNWSAARLTPEQIAYAATDAWVSRELYVRLVQGGAADQALAGAGPVAV